MTRRPPPVRTALRASGDRWLFGYADIVTLLFACFASLYATGLAPAADAMPASPVATAANATGAPMAPANLLTESADAAAKSETATGLLTGTDVAVPDPTWLPKLELELAAVVGREGTLPGIDLSTSARGLVISMPEAGSFPAGQAQLSARARQLMLDLAARLRPLPNFIRVEGHTDDMPIHNASFASNWELSTARATRVVQFLVDACDMDASHLSAAGYAEHRPLRSNDSPDARARNRRVDIVILDAAAATFEEPGRTPQ